MRASAKSIVSLHLGFVCCSTLFPITLLQPSTVTQRRSQRFHSFMFPSFM
jgi:hypothetical protein